MLKEKYTIFTIQGGAGKNVLATAVIKALKKSEPDRKIIILTAYKDVWLYNPNVYRIYTFGNTPNFYKDYIESGNDIKIHNLEPYASSNYILSKKHLIEIWCDLCNIEYDDELPELFFNQRELEYAVRKYELNKGPILLIQSNGGAPQEMKYSWMRDMPFKTATELVNHYSKSHRVIHIRREDQIQFPNIESFNGNLRELMILIKYSNNRVFIDSFCQHVAAALNLKSTVLWIRNKPEMLGYNIHDNIVTSVGDELDIPSDDPFNKYNILGDIYQCPFKEGTELFDTEDIINSINNQSK